MSLRNETVIVDLLKIDREPSVATSSGVGLWRQDPFTVRGSPAASVRAARSLREYVSRSVPKTHRVTQEFVSVVVSIAIDIARANGSRQSTVCDYYGKTLWRHHGRYKSDSGLHVPVFSVWYARRYEGKQLSIASRLRNVSSVLENV